MDIFWLLKVNVLQTMGLRQCKTTVPDPNSIGDFMANVCAYVQLVPVPLSPTQVFFQ